MGQKLEFLGTKQKSQQEMDLKIELIIGITIYNH